MHNTPLHNATSRYACIEYVKSLTEYYKEHYYDKGETPLFNACHTGNKKILDHFIKNNKMESISHQEAK